MTQNEKLEQLLEQSYMDDYTMYTREDMVRFGVMVLHQYGVNKSVDKHLQTLGQSRNVHILTGFVNKSAYSYVLYRNNSQVNNS